MSSYERSLEIVEKLEAAGITVTVDPRSATPPCVLGNPLPDRDYLAVACGYSAAFQWFILVPGPANADTAKTLDALADDVAAALDCVERMTFVSYSLSPDNPPFPAYRVDFTEAI